MNKSQKFALKHKLRTLVHNAIKRVVERTTPLIAFLIRQMTLLIYLTCRLETKGFETFKELASHHSAICILWHNRLFIPPLIASHYFPDQSFKTLVSKGRDGDISHRVLSFFSNISSIRSDSSHRGATLHKIVNCLEKEKCVIVLTPDGPMGPKYSFKPGVAFAAIKTGVSVFPVTWEASRYWEIPLTWDGLRLPKPFAKITFTIGSPLQFDPNTTLEEASNLLKKALHHECATS